MHVSELWCEKNLQDVLGSIAYPKDRLKILNQYQKQKKIRIRKQNSRGFREEKENIFN
jgi:V8-like Glu-specific endopeptidase